MKSNHGTPHESVDIVDDTDRILYKTTKQEAHEKGLLHRTVICEVIDTDGKWLLVKQSSDRQDAGQYVSPVGGHVRAGESVEEAMKREAFEELGLSSDSFTFKYIGKAIFNRDIRGRRENHFFILYEVYSDQIPTLNHESDEYKSFSLEELKKALDDHPEYFGEAFYFVLKTFYPALHRPS